jgi:hypothetical protein
MFNDSFASAAGSPSSRRNHAAETKGLPFLAAALIVLPTTDRAKLGSKRHLICDGRGIPLAIQLTGANRHDTTRPPTR